MMRLNIQRFAEENVTGYNQHRINQVITSVKTGYENFFRSFDNDTKNTVERISHLWESGTAKSFFQNRFKIELEDLINGSTGLNNCVNSIINAIANAGNSWSSKLENNDHFSNDFSQLTLDISIDQIQDHFPDSSSGADIDGTKNEADSQLNTMERHVSECCDQLKNAVSEAAFLDVEGLQHQSLNSAIDKVNDSFKEAIETIRTGLTNAVESETNDIKAQAQATEFNVR